MSKFLMVWFGQAVSLLGSGLTSFALGIWVYQQTGSVMNFGLISLLVALPTLLVSPFSGVVVDRSNRRTIMLLSDLAEGMSILALAVLFFTHRLDLFEVYFLVALGSVAGAFRVPSYMALMSQIVEGRQIGRASGLMQLGPAAAQILSPVLAGALIGSIGFQGIFLLDAVTFLFAIVTLLAIRVPPAPFLATKPAKPGLSLLKEAMEGWSYILERPGLRGLLVFFALLNITFNSSEILLIPMILGFANTAVLGRIMSIGAVGFIAGGLLISAWGGSKKRVHGLLGFSLVYSAGMVLSGLRPSPMLVSVAIFIALFQVPMINACSQAIWQRKTPHDIQGRIFAARLMTVSASTPIAFFLAAPLADHVFGPLLQNGGYLAQTCGRFLGTGPGRGIGLFLVLNGLAALLISAGCFANRRLWRVEDELEDVESAVIASSASY
jgi:DHA3 family macrolide efflux protein-like MFS transporter